MKKLIYILAAGALFMTACHKPQEQASAEPQTTPAQALIDRLHAIQDSGLIAFGHHDDMAYGYTWKYVDGNSDVKLVTGDYPAIADWDLGWIELQSPVNLDTVPFDWMRDEIRKHHERGGINALSWHLTNPVTGGNSWDVSDNNSVPQMVTPGTAANDSLHVWAARVADYIASLRDSEGNAIPVIFRPWHEHTGGWFYWGDGHRTPEQYKQLWQVVREEFDAKGVDNAVWAYSPDRCQTVEQYMECYPGDEYIDIMGADVYHFVDKTKPETYAQSNQWYQNDLGRTLGFATDMAKEHGKVVALTETGSETLPVADWYTNVLYPVIKDYPIAYMVVWRNAMPQMKEGHFYVPYQGHPAEADFIEFYNLPQTAFLNDIKDIK